MATATNKRAKAGGEFGANGEWYEGGKFIATTERPKTEGTRPRGSRRVEIAPYTWAMAPAGMTSIYRCFAGTLGKLVGGHYDKVARAWVGGKLEVLCSQQTLEYLATTREEAQALADRYNAGERFILIGTA